MIEISGHTKLAAVIGNPVEHSKSPAIHNAAFAELGIDAVYVALDVPDDELVTVVEALCAVKMIGASVTVPYKRAVMELCDELSSTAEAIGAVNTLQLLEDGRLVGHNTDAPGYVRALEAASGLSIRGRKAVVLGAGGAARAVYQGILEAGAESVELVARSPEKVDLCQAHPWEAAALEELLTDCQLLVDGTSIGLSAEREAQIPCAIPVALLPDDAIVSTLVYHRQTALLAEAAARNLVTVDGSGMLVHQGAIAFELWTGQRPSVEVMSAAMRA